MAFFVGASVWKMNTNDRFPTNCFSASTIARIENSSWRARFYRFFFFFFSTFGKRSKPLDQTAMDYENIVCWKLKISISYLSPACIITSWRSAAVWPAGIVIVVNLRFHRYPPREFVTFLYLYPAVYASRQVSLLNCRLTVFRCFNILFHIMSYYHTFLWFFFFTFFK